METNENELGFVVIHDMYLGKHCSFYKMDKMCTSVYICVQLCTTVYNCVQLCTTVYNTDIKTFAVACYLVFILTCSCYFSK